MNLFFKTLPMLLLAANLYSQDKELVKTKLPLQGPKVLEYTYGNPNDARPSELTILDPISNKNIKLAFLYPTENKMTVQLYNDDAKTYEPVTQEYEKESVYTIQRSGYEIKLILNPTPGTSTFKLMSMYEKKVSKKLVELTCYNEEGEIYLWETTKYWQNEKTTTSRYFNNDGVVKQVAETK
ncbi:MAG: hypothetical protein V1647_06895, partial [Pseudomonadota bacterium]